MSRPPSALFFQNQLHFILINGRFSTNHYSIYHPGFCQSKGSTAIYDTQPLQVKKRLLTPFICSVWSYINFDHTIDVLKILLTTFVHAEPHIVIVIGTCQNFIIFHLYISFPFQSSLYYDVPWVSCHILFVTTTCFMWHLLYCYPPRWVTFLFVHHTL